MVRKRVVFFMASKGALHAGIIKQIRRSLGQKRACFSFTEVLYGGYEDALIAEAAQQVLKQEYDIVIPIGIGSSSVFIREAQANKSKVPIIACGLDKPVDRGLIRSLSAGRENQNVICVGSTSPDYILVAQLLALALPVGTRLLLPYREGALRGMVQQKMGEVRSYLADYGIEVVLFPFADDLLPSCDFLDAFKGIDGIVTPEGCLMPSDVTTITALAEPYDIEVFSDGSSLKIKGVLFCLKYDLIEVGREIVNRLLAITIDGKQPHELSSVIIENIRGVSCNDRRMTKRGLVPGEAYVVTIDHWVRQGKRMSDEDFGRAYSYLSALQHGNSVLAHVILAQITESARELLSQHPKLSGLGSVQETSLEEQVQTMVAHAGPATEHFVFGAPIMKLLHAEMKRTKKWNNVIFVQIAEAVEEANALSLDFPNGVSCVSFVVQALPPSLPLAMCKLHMKDCRRVFFPVTVDASFVTDEYRQRVSDACKAFNIRERWVCEESYEAVVETVKNVVSPSTAIVALPHLTRKGCEQALAKACSERQTVFCGPDLYEIIIYPLAAGLYDGVFDLDLEHNRYEGVGGANMQVIFVDAQTAYDTLENTELLKKLPGGRVNMVLSEVMVYVRTKQRMYRSRSRQRIGL